ncbi:MAG: addiction module protein [Proteobacteria bacterium]|nr:addiction module protein [Pseudomonadota bacterium]
MIQPNDLKHLSREDKLIMMEALWDDLCRDDNQIDSPAWHEKALLETKHQLDQGQINITDWEEAKKSLRKRFE